MQIKLSITRKRIFIIICVIGIVCLLIRYFLFLGALDDDSQVAQEAQDNLKLGPRAPVIVMVYYEALCPDSKHFITKQLLPSYQHAAPIMDVQLVPYGKAQTHMNADGSFRFDCQHGPPECEANTYHACAIEAIEDALARVEVIECMMRDNRSPKEAMHRCARQHNIENIDLMQKCFDSSHGAELLKVHGDATHALRPPITFIPTITLDGSQGRQAAILKNLLSEVCKIAGNSAQAKEICENQPDIASG